MSKLHVTKSREAVWEDRKTQVDSLDPAKLGTAQLVHEISMPGSSQKVVKVTGVPRKNASVTILVRGSNKLVLEEADRSLHDALQPRRRGGRTPRPREPVAGRGY